MFEKVNPAHPDKIADRIAGAIVDYAYKYDDRPRIAVEVLIGHGMATIVIESSVHVSEWKVGEIVERIAGEGMLYRIYSFGQDENLAKNQKYKIRCGDNGIFRGVPITKEQRRLSGVAREIYKKFPTDGKMIIHNNRITVCQSCAPKSVLERLVPNAKINPLGDWTGGLDVDTGATNRKLGSDMGDAVTGGGLHGKDLSKADVSVNIYAHVRAEQLQCPVEISCSIGDEYVDGHPYEEIVEIARQFIQERGGFEKFAEWGLI